MTLVKYTLLAARRGRFKRGASFTVPVGSSDDLKYRDDRAWSRLVCTPTPSITNGQKSAGKSLAVAAKSYVLNLEAKLNGLSSEEQMVYRQAILRDDAMHTLLERALPNGRQTSTESDDEPEEEEEVVLADPSSALRELQEALDDGDSKRKDLLSLADAAGLSLANPPRSTAEVVDTLRMLISQNPDPTDIG